MTVEIKRRATGEVLYVWDVPEGHEGISPERLLGRAVVAAVRAGVSLRGANLRNTVLRWADLRGADLWGADLWGADLWGADLWGADLRGADLRGADLRNANLRRTDLTGAHMAGARWGEGVTLQSTPIEVANLAYPVRILDNHMEIGCQIHTFEKWEAFTDEDIRRLNFLSTHKVLTFWHTHKAALLALCATRGKGAEKGGVA